VNGVPGAADDRSGFSKDDVLDLLHDLARELEAGGMRGQVFLVGGAAIAVAYNARRLTRDLDGVFEPKARVYEAARAVALRRGLPDDWLNDAVKGFLPGPDPGARVYFDEPGLSVQVVSARYLFILKAMAARQARDAEDLELLFPLTGFASVEQALKAIQAAYPHRALEPKVRFFVEEVLAGLTEELGSSDP
jgi:hypothetical protein